MFALSLKVYQIYILLIYSIKTIFLDLYFCEQQITIFKYLYTYITTLIKSFQFLYHSMQDSL